MDIALASIFVAEGLDRLRWGFSVFVAEGLDRLRWGFSVLISGILQTPRPDQPVT